VPAVEFPLGTAMLSGPSTPVAVDPLPVYVSLFFDDARAGVLGAAVNDSLVRCVLS
jgi:hypothetical protein